MDRVITEIYIYPVKSLAGIPLTTSELDVRGLQYDRKWMVVDSAGRFFSQREHPKMALIGTAIDGNSLVLFNRLRPDDFVCVPLELQGFQVEKTNVQVWSSRLKAFWQGGTVDAWLSNHLGHNVRLVQLPDTAKRVVDRRYAPSGHYVRFADAFPFLLVGTASLQDLNEKMQVPVGYDRFRPNLVVQSEQPFEEDNWSEMLIGGHSFTATKSCARCVMVTIDQWSLQKDSEPLKLLSQFRKRGNKVLFGQYLIWTGWRDTKCISVGDRVEVLTMKS